MREVFYQAMAAGCRQLPLKTLHTMADGCGSFLWKILKSRRKLATEAIEFHLEVPRDEAERIARESFKQNFKSFLEIFANHRMDYVFTENNITIEGRKHYQAMCDTDRPVIMSTAHFGSWELLSGLFDLLITPQRPKGIVVRRPKDLAMHRTMVDMRSRPHTVIIDHRNAVRNVLKLLKKKGQVAFLVDHNCMIEEAVFLPFLNKVAAVNMGPALLGIRANALIQPVFLIRNPNQHYTVHFDAPLDTRDLKGDRDEKIAEVAGFYSRAVENMIRLYPEQWFWMHKRWKTRPPEEQS